MPSAVAGSMRSAQSRSAAPSSPAGSTSSSGAASPLDSPACPRDHPPTPIMNGVHDLGGMHGFGPIEREPNEPTFHADWEKAVLTMNLVGMARRLYNIDEFRHGVERMGQADYLTSSYYEHWLASISTLLVEKGVIGRDELEARTRDVARNPDAPLPARRDPRRDSSRATPSSRATGSRRATRACPATRAATAGAST